MSKLDSFPNNDSGVIAAVVTTLGTEVTSAINHVVDQL
jgi:hypothetical protein